MNVLGRQDFEFGGFDWLCVWEGAQPGYVLLVTGLKLMQMPHLPHRKSTTGFVCFAELNFYKVFGRLLHLTFVFCSVWWISFNICYHFLLRWCSASVLKAKAQWWTGESHVISSWRETPDRVGGAITNHRALKEFTVTFGSRDVTFCSSGVQPLGQLSNPNGLLSQKLRHYLDQGRTLNDILWRAAHCMAYFDLGKLNFL